MVSEFIQICYHAKFSFCFHFIFYLKVFDLKIVRLFFASTNRFNKHWMNEHHHICPAIFSSSSFQYYLRLLQFQNSLCRAWRVTFEEFIFLKHLSVFGSWIVWLVCAPKITRKCVYDWHIDGGIEFAGYFPCIWSRTKILQPRLELNSSSKVLENRLFVSQIHIFEELESIKRKTW